jgi:hypothetical protein
MPAELYVRREERQICQLLPALVEDTQSVNHLEAPDA